MVARDAFSGDADGRFERVVCGAVLGDALTLKGLGAHAAVGWLEDGRRVVVLRVGSEQAADPGRFADRGEPMEMLWVGGAAEDAPEIERLLTTTFGSDARGWLVTETGDVVPLGDTPPVGPALVLLSDAPPDWPRFWEQVDAIAAKGTAARPTPLEPSEVDPFEAVLAARTTRGTVGLLVAIFAVYVLGMAFGAPDYVPALTRMGSLYHARVYAGEVWRLWSSGFLHGGPIHLAMNAYALWRLGRYAERVLGTPRFLVLYALSGLGGGLLSLLLTDGSSVGASGALWGLMTAELVFVLRPGLLPGAHRTRRQGAVFQDLLLNTAISFSPGVDGWGHAGGGLAGAALIYSGLLTAGLPRWGDADPGEDHVPTWVPRAARGLTVAMAASVLLAVGLGRPWELGAPGPLVPVRLGKLSLAAPAGLAAVEVEGQGMIGDFFLDPVAIWAFQGPSPGVGKEAEEQVSSELHAPSEGLELVGYVDRDEVGGVPLFAADYRGDGYRMHRVVLLREASLVAVELTAWSDTPTAWDALAREIAVSVVPAEDSVVGE